MPQALPKARARKRASKTAKTYRFDARLNEYQKRMIQRAADLEGRTMTDFVLHSAQEAARKTIEMQDILLLTARDAEIFAKAILNPPGPGPVLRKAARDYLKKTGLR